VKTTEGKIELAQGGTLFLDEVGDIPLPLQVKLLRFIQERVIERVGGRKSIEVDTRIVCATHRNLKKMIADGAFRDDLYYRIAEVTISIPPLREREGDAALLANHFLRRYTADRPGSAQLRFGPGALAAINLHSWPGNVRELENRVKRAVIMADGASITAADLDLADSPDAVLQTLRESRMSSDRRAITAALTAASGSISQAARLLGISRPTLYDMIRELNIQVS
jgi:two-component system NtrC family response regulator